MEGGSGGGEAAPSGTAEAGEPSLEGLSVRPGKYRDMQLRQDGKRKLFKGKARKVFLEWLAATGNVVLSATKAGFAYQTVWKHRLKDPDFADEVDRALDQGVVRATARLVEDKVRGRIEIDGDFADVELEPADPQIVLNILGARERARQGHPRLQRTTARIASNKEVEKALKKRLAVFARRERAMRRGAGGSDG
jgi:hypothetical protein